MHTVRFGFKAARFAEANGYTLGLCAKEARLWCADQGLTEDVDFTFHSECALGTSRYLDWVFVFREDRPATLFKVRFSDFL